MRKHIQKLYQVNCFDSPKAGFRVFWVVLNIVTTVQRVYLDRVGPCGLENPGFYRHLLLPYPRSMKDLDLLIPVPVRYTAPHLSIPQFLNEGCAGSSPIWSKSMLSGRLSGESPRLRLRVGYPLAVGRGAISLSEEWTQASAFRPWGAPCP